MRAWGRTFSWRLAVGGMAGAIIVTADMLLEGVGGDRRSWTRNAPVALPVGASLAAWQYHRLRTKMVAEGVTHDAGGDALDDSQGVAVGKAVGIGAGVSAALYVAARAEKLFAGGVGSVITSMNPRAELIGRPVGHGVAFGLLGLAGVKGLQHVFASAETTGDAVEAAYSTAPTSEFVSGGPRSVVPLETIGREGRRFVNMALTIDEIEAVMGGAAKPPIRVFVGLESAHHQRAGRPRHARARSARGVRAHAHRVRVPDRNRLPQLRDRRVAGVPDPGRPSRCVAMQYSLRPSPLSLNRVGIGIDQNTAFLHALKWRLAAIPEDKRPRLLIFGESLGAQTSEDIFAEEGTEGLHRSGIDRGLFLGTPAATKWRQRWLSHPAGWIPTGRSSRSTPTRTTWRSPTTSAPRAVLPAHPLQRPDAEVLVPAGGAGTRVDGTAGDPRTGCPRETPWRPYTTFLITFIDVKNAMHVIPGQFVAEGHDYRKPRPLHLAGLRPARRRRDHHRAEQGPRRPRAQMGRDAGHRPTVRRRRCRGQGATGQMGRRRDRADAGCPGLRVRPPRSGPRLRPDPGPCPGPHARIPGRGHRGRGGRPSSPR